MSTGCNCNKGLLLSFSLARTQHVLRLLEKVILKKARAKIITHITMIALRFVNTIRGYMRVHS